MIAIQNCLLYLLSANSHRVCKATSKSRKHDDPSPQTHNVFLSIVPLTHFPYIHIPKFTLTDIKYKWIKSRYHVMKRNI